MALTTAISKRELKRVAAASYEGRTLKSMLCNVGVSGYTEESTVANWQSVELTDPDYTRFSTTIATGSYSGTEARYQMPTINAVFSASSAGDGLVYDRVVSYINGETYVHSVITEDPNIALAPGQTQTYQLDLATND